jgi:hypothetical protein
MIVLVLLIVAAVIFGLLAISGLYRSRETWEPNVAYLAWCALAIALAIWHQG